MFSSKLADYAGVGVLSLASMLLPSCRQSGTEPEIRSPEATEIGSAGDAGFYIKEIEGKMFLVFDGFYAAGIAEHTPNLEQWQPGTPHTFESSEVSGSIGDITLYKVKVDGISYLYGDGFKAGELIRVP